MNPFDIEDILEIGIAFFLAEISVAVLIGVLGFESKSELLSYISRKFK